MPAATCGKCYGRQKTKGCNRNSLEKCVNCVQNRVINFSRECPSMVKDRAFLLGKTTSTVKKRITDLALKIFLILSLLNVHSLRNKCCRLRNFAIENSVYFFCMSKTWLYDDNFAIISALTSE